MSDTLPLATIAQGAFDALVTAAGDDPRKLSALARSAPKLGHGAAAYALAKRARAMAPGDAEVVAQTHDAFVGDVPDWHFRIIVDRRRNQVYEAAIARVVRPGDRVLDIGTGTGLLSMLAARAGASKVVTCEMVPAVADAARQIIADNGLADRITVLGKSSTDIDVEGELGGPVDVLVSEILSNDLIGEGMLPTTDDAIARLLKPGGKMVPIRGQVMVALAELAGLEERALGTIAGFDVSAFNRLSATPFRIDPTSPKLRVRGKPVELFGFDFEMGKPWGPTRAVRDLHLDGSGRANGVLLWMRFDLDEETSYEVTPGQPSSWALMFQPLDVPVSAKRRKPVRVRGAHDHLHVRYWVEEDGVA